MYLPIWLTFLVLVLTFIVTAVIGKNLVKTLISVAIIGALSVLSWLLDPWFAPFFAFALMSWAAIFCQNNGFSDKVRTSLIVGQVPMIVYCLSVMATTGRINWIIAFLTLLVSIPALIFESAFKPN